MRVKGIRKVYTYIVCPVDKVIPDNKAVIFRKASFATYVDAACMSCSTIDLRAKPEFGRLLKLGGAHQNLKGSFTIHVYWIT